MTTTPHPKWATIPGQTRKYVERKIAAPRDPAFAAGLAALSQHQRNLLRARCEGMDEGQLATYFGISRQTVKNHFWIIYRALGIEKRGRGGSGRCVAIACYKLGRYDQDADAEGIAA